MVASGSFPQLESGAYPSFAEIGELQARGVDCEAILDENRDDVAHTVLAELLAAQAAQDSGSELPANVVALGARVAPPRLPDAWAVGACVQLSIVEVSSPAKFWFHVDADRRRLELLMTQIG